MRERDIVGQLAGDLPVVTLDHERARPAGVIGIHERDDLVVALCAHRCDLSSAPGIATLRHLERLDLGGNRLTALPALPASLRELYVYDNQLERLPELPRLRVLDANRNRLVAIPPLEGVDYVYLAENRLVASPAVAGVRYLNLGGNPLASIETLGDAALVELRLEHAGLAEIPSAIRRLAGLRELSLRDNVIQLVPAWLGELTTLTTLDSRGNQIDDLPDELARLPLRKLDLRWNPLRHPPDRIAELRARGCLVYC